MPDISLSTSISNNETLKLFEEFKHLHNIAATNHECFPPNAKDDVGLLLQNFPHLQFVFPRLLGDHAFLWYILHPPLQGICPADFEAEADCSSLILPIFLWPYPCLLQ